MIRPYLSRDFQKIVTSAALFCDLVEHAAVAARGGWRPNGSADNLFNFAQHEMSAQR